MRPGAGSGAARRRSAVGWGLGGECAGGRRGGGAGKALAVSRTSRGAGGSR